MKYYNLILSLVIVALLIWVATLQRTIYVSQAKISRIEKQSLKVKPVNEDLLLSLQERDTSLILTCLGVGFGLFSFLTFKGVHDLFKLEVVKVNEQYIKADDNYKFHDKKLKSLEKDLCYTHSTIIYERAKIHLEKGEIEDYALVYLAGLEKSCQVLDLNEDENELFVKATKSSLDNGLENIYKALSSIDGEIEIEDITKERFNKRIELISKHISLDSMSTLFNIAGKFKIIEPTK